MSPEGHPAGHEPAAGPGSQLGGGGRPARVFEIFITEHPAGYELIFGKQQPAPAEEDWHDLYAAYETARRQAQSDFGRAWSKIARDWTEHVQSQMERGSIRAALAEQAGAGRGVAA